MKPISPKISDTAAEFYPGIFRTLNAGATYILESFPQVYRLTMNSLKGRFERGELMLIVDVFNGTMLTPQLAGQHLLLSCSDGIELDHLDDKWGIDKGTFIDKLKSLTLFEASCFEIWANGFWYRSNPEDPLDIEKWVSRQVKEK